MMDFIFIVSGLFLLFFGGESLLKGSVSLARNLGLSKLLVGAVIVGFGTSMPEMTVSVGAALKGSSEIALGNIVGSNIANILLIIGLSILIFPITISGPAVRRDAAVMMAASVLLCCFALLGYLNMLAGIFMLAALVAYVYFSYQSDKKRTNTAAENLEQEIEGEKLLKPFVAVGFSVLGLALLVGGAYLLVEGAISIARSFGITEAVIGLTIVAVGTSLPELATSIVAAMRKHADVIIGNIVGSNIFNIFAILGVTAIIQPIPFMGQIANFDVWIMLAVALLLSAFLWFGLRMGRGVGIVMLGLYTAYTAWLYMGTVS